MITLVRKKLRLQRPASWYPEDNAGYMDQRNIALSRAEILISPSEILDLNLTKRVGYDLNFSGRNKEK